jgi:hypothetical protein
MAFFRLQKRVLLLGNEGICLFGPTFASGIGHETSIAWDSPDFNQKLVAALTAKNRGNPVLIIFDGADQAYRKEENIPKLSVFDRPRFIKRKLEQAFPSYPIRASFEVPAVQQKGGPKAAPSYLFVAIPETDNIDKVSAALLEAGVPVAGFGLLPAESAGLVTALANKLFIRKGGKSRWAVLITQNETGGLRQVVVKDGRLALTRMTPTSEGGLQGEGWAEEVLREFKATLTYLARFGYTADEGLDVIIICGENEKRLLDQKQLPATNFQCLKVPEALQTIGASGKPSGEMNFGDMLHAAWASKKSSLAVPISVPSIYNVMMPRLVARMASVAMKISILLLIGLSVSSYISYAPIQQSIVEKQAQKVTLDGEYKKAAEALEALPVKPVVVRSALAVKQTLDDDSISLTPTLNLLHKALDSDIKLRELSFERVSASAAKGGKGTRDNLKVIFRFTLLGNLPLEQKVARAEKIAATMKLAFTGYDVKISSQFGRLSRTGRFSGTAGESDKPNAAADSAENFAEIEMQGAPL